MNELIKKYREYVEHLIVLSCGDTSDYKFDETRADNIEGQPLRGNNYVIWQGSVNKEWVRIPSPDFDKDSVVCYYCGRYYDRWRVLNAVSSTHPDKLIVVSYTHK
jgi:hypothetical protein